MYDVRLVGVMWSLFLIGQLHFSGIWHGLLLRTHAQKICVAMRLEYVLISKIQ